jgi:hypothetical protein
MIGLANSGMMSQESFTKFGEAATRQFEALIAAGLVENEALMLMAPSLEVLRDLMKEYGLEVDEDTQKILDLADANGVLKAEGKDTNTLMIEGIRAMTEGIGTLIELFGGEVPDSIRNMTDTMRGESEEQSGIWAEYRDQVIEDSEAILREQTHFNELATADLRAELRTREGDYGNFVDGVNRAIRDINTDIDPVIIDIDWGEVPDIPINLDLSHGIPGAAHGGIISRPGLFMGGEGGEPEMIGPVSFMTDALRGALAGVGPTPSDAELLNEMRGLRKDLRLMPIHLRDAIILSN